jgi:hypothetical protein
MEVKMNPPTLYKTLEALDCETYSSLVETVDRGHGRIETRTVRTAPVPESIVWPYANPVFRIDRHVTDLLGENPRDETAFGISDRNPQVADASGIGTLVRGHWGIETRLHYVRDMTYDEDRSQVRTGNEPRAMAILRNTAIGLLRRLQLPNIQRAVNHLHRRADRVTTLLLSLTAAS